MLLQPELLSLWNISLADIDTTNIDIHSESEVSLIVRPAQIQMKFAQFIELLQQQDDDVINQKSNFYLEYFPVPVLLNLAQEYIRKSRNSNEDAVLTSRRAFSQFKNKIPDNSWSDFLSLRYHLLWLSGGTVPPKYPAKAYTSTPTPPDVNTILKNHLEGLNIKTRRQDGSEKTTSQQSPTKTAKEESGSGAVSTSRLHFDRYENIMNVIQGSKIFHLFPPSESSNLYGGSPVITGSFTAVSSTTEAAVGENRGPHSHLHSHSQEALSGYTEPSSATCVETNVSVNNNNTLYTFSRDIRTVNFVPNVYHTYSPVDILRPDFPRFPRLEAGMRGGGVCEVNAGDRVFVPAHWWHQASGCVL
jgi:hypothetical protein